MNTTFARSLFFFAALAASVFVLVSFSPAEASHAWGYHWARTASPFTLKLGDNVNSTWDSYLATASSDWSTSASLDTSVVTTLTSKSCRAVKGRGEVCNAKYGRTGWLGIAQIWVSGEHITAGVVKLNDTYFNTSTYNTPSWKQYVMCQEVGHIFGLDHQDENLYNANLGTCMDYTNSPARNDGAGNNEHPNLHDYSMLATIYAHLDTTTTLASGSLTNRRASAEEIGDDPRTWGREIRRSSDGRESLYLRDLGNDEKVMTHVIWADQGRDHEDHAER